MLILAAIEHQIRRLVAAFDCGLTERARGFSDVEAGDFLVATERARQQLVEREAEEDVAEPATPCPIHEEWCAGATCWWVAHRAAAGLPNVPAGVSAAPKPAPPAGLDSLPWSTADLADDWWLKGAFPGGVVDSRGCVIGRFDTMAQADAVVTAINAANERAQADTRITHRLNAAGFQQGRDFDPPFRK